MIYAVGGIVYTVLMLYKQSNNFKILLFASSDMASLVSFGSLERYSLFPSLIL